MSDSTPKKKPTRPRTKKTKRDPNWIDPKSSFLISPKILRRGTPLPRKIRGEDYHTPEDQGPDAR